MLIAYNNERTIAETFHSLMSQSYTPLEMIVVFDEASKDATGPVLEKIIEPFLSTAKLLRVNGVGRSTARNAGWRASRGTAVLFADGDDVYFSDYLRKSVGLLNSNPQVGCVCVTGASVTEGSGWTAKFFELYTLVQRKLREKDGWRPSWAWVYRRTPLEQVGGFDDALSQAEDKDLYLRVLAKGWEVGVVDGVNWLHRRPRNFISYVGKAYVGGARRLRFAIKHGEIRDLVKSAVPLWALVALIPVWVADSSASLAIIGILSALLVREVVQTAVLVWSDVPRKHFVLLYSLFALIGYLATAAGYTWSLLSTLLRQKMDG